MLEQYHLEVRGLREAELGQQANQPSPCQHGDAELSLETACNDFSCQLRPNAALRSADPARAFQRDGARDSRVALLFDSPQQLRLPDAAHDAVVHSHAWDLSRILNQNGIGHCTPQALMQDSLRRCRLPSGDSSSLSRERLASKTHAHLVQTEGVSYPSRKIPYAPGQSLCTRTKTAEMHFSTS